MSASQSPLAPGLGLPRTSTLATAFDEETEVVRRGRATPEDEDEQTLRGRMIPESAEAPAAVTIEPAATTLLPAAPAPTGRTHAVLWLAGAGAVLGIAAALAAQAL